MQLGAMRPIDPRTRRRRRGPATSPELQHPRAAAARGSWARGLPALGVSLLVLGPLVAAPGAGAADQGPYRGRVVDAVTGQPLADAVAILVWEHEHPEGLARAIREVIRDRPVADREALRAVTRPVLLVCIEGDEIHPAEFGHVLHELMPASELVVYPSQEALFAALPELVERVGRFLLG